MNPTTRLLSLCLLTATSAASSCAQKANSTEDSNSRLESECTANTCAPDPSVPDSSTAREEPLHSGGKATDRGPSASPVREPEAETDLPVRSAADAAPPTNTREDLRPPQPDWNEHSSSANEDELNLDGGVVLQTPVDAGSVDRPGSLDAGIGQDAGHGVLLRAITMQVFPDGTEGISAEWTNRTEQSIFLRGCATTDGSFFDGNEWQLYGAFALCTAETPMVEVLPGETYLDPSGAPPPQRGTDVWRLVGPYGVGCRPSVGLFSEAECETKAEITSANEIHWNP